MKDLSAERARVQVYDQGLAVIQSREMVADKQLLDPTSLLSLSLFPALQTSITSSSESAAELVKVLADALNANRIPVPEPSVFSGDPLKYSDWKLSFETPIDQKNIQEKEKIYYLRRYVSG